MSARSDGLRAGTVARFEQCNLRALLCKTQQSFPVAAADVTNVEAELLKNAAGDPAVIAELQARVKELEMEQSLMQRELDNMSDVAQRTDNQLRCGQHRLVVLYRLCMCHLCHPFALAC